LAKELAIPDNELRALDVLNRQAVKYLLIGGLAMRFYGASREVQDVDLLTETSPINAERLFRAIEKLVGHPPVFSAEDLARPRKKVNLRSDGYDLDILTSVDGLEFDAAYQNREAAVERSVVVPVVSKEDLLFIKRCAAKDEKRRAKELADISFLESG
jgi:predicted nucleotidyltransferase